MQLLLLLAARALSSGSLQHRPLQTWLCGINQCHYYIAEFSLLL
jgi:hypothetical protein